MTNAVVLDVNSRSEKNSEVLREPDCIVWTAELDGRTVVAVFAVGDAPLEIRLPLKSIGLMAEATGVEAWTGEKSRVVDGRLVVSLPVHGAALHILI